jgi:hypothetical protein
MAGHLAMAVRFLAMGAQVLVLSAAQPGERTP